MMEAPDECVCLRFVSKNVDVFLKKNWRQISQVLHVVIVTRSGDAIERITW
jgi:hypothetical protein